MSHLKDKHVKYTEIRSAETLTCRARHMNDLTQLVRQLSPGRPAITAMRIDALFAAGTRVFVATYTRTTGSERRIVGMVLLCRTEMLVGTKDWIEDVVVDAGHRGLGIAGRLMDMAEAASRSTGAKHLNLTSNPERGPARDMYIKRGYTLCDTGVFRLKFD
jgi:GNAT superfamily N-acetyltransferase